ncbi:MAG TPA: alkaline phosphatase family protein, partial [Thermoanaerobaculia bacterium]|nr:alkaline phosphatase family protein [Thermoanaerobaculia bacterium]
MKRALLLALFAVHCSRPASRPDVLLITIDTFRADRINENTPNLLALARRGEWYRNADAAVPMTLPSHATLLSGLLPLHHGLHLNGAGSF